MAQTLIIKILEKFYKEVELGNKTFELRKDDRNYEIGDTIKFRVIKDNGEMVDSPLTFKIAYIVRNVSEYGLQDGYCIFSIKRTDE